jgi:hypothetical protein
MKWSDTKLPIYWPSYGSRRGSEENFSVGENLKICVLPDDPWLECSCKDFSKRPPGFLLSSTNQVTLPNAPIGTVHHDAFEYSSSRSQSREDQRSPRNSVAASSRTLCRNARGPLG